MNFFYSMFTTFFIVILFWSLAVFQTNIAQAFEQKNVEITFNKNNEIEQISNITEETKRGKSQPIKLAGIKEHIKLQDIKILWDRFNEATELHNNLKSQPKKIYVVYQKVSNNYQEADVTIGYNIDAISKFNNAFSVDISEQEILLPKKQYSDIALAEAWEKINYSKNIHHILEVHSLDLAGKTTATQMFVSYQ